MCSNFTSSLLAPFKLQHDSPSYAIYSRGIRDLEDLPRFLQARILYQPGDVELAECEAVLRWGMKDNVRDAEQIAQEHGKHLIRLEDGFVRSLDLGFRCPPYSIVVDDLGMYYDGTRPSRLEEMIKRPISEDAQERARALRQLWCEQRVSKYNGAPEYSENLPEKFVLVVDQTRNDVSVKLGCVSETAFVQMLQAALDENPEHDVVLKVHPDVLAGHKKGAFDLKSLPKVSRLKVIGSAAHPVAFVV